MAIVQGSLMENLLSGLMSAPFDLGKGVVKGAIYGYKRRAGEEAARQLLETAGDEALQQAAGGLFEGTRGLVEMAGRSVGWLGGKTARGAAWALGPAKGPLKAAARKTGEVAGETLRETASEGLRTLEGVWEVGKNVLTEPVVEEGAQAGLINLSRTAKPWVREAIIPVAMVGGVASGASRGAASPVGAHPSQPVAGLPGVTRSSPITKVDDMGATGDIVFAMNNMR